MSKYKERDILLLASTDEDLNLIQQTLFAVDPYLEERVEAEYECVNALKRMVR